MSSAQAAEAHAADWPAQAGSGTSRNNRRASPQDAPAGAPTSEREPHGRRVVVHRRSSSSSSTTIVVHSYEAKSTSATACARNSPPPPGADNAATFGDVAPDSARGSRQPTNYADADADADADANANHAERRPFSQANKLPSSPACNSASQRGVNQLGSGSFGAAASASGRLIESPQQPEQRQIMNNNNKRNCTDSPTNYVVGRNGAAAPDATGNTSHKRLRRPQIKPDAANDDAADDDDDELDDADYSVSETADLQRHSNGTQREPSWRQHSATTQMNRSHFYNNLFNTNNEPTASRPTGGEVGGRASGRRRVHEQATMGSARRAKSATLPGREVGCTDFGYHEIRPPSARYGHPHPHQNHQHHHHQQRLNRQQVVAHGQAIRNDLITSMKSPQRASMRLGASGLQNSPARTNGSSENNSMAPYGSFGSSSQRASRSSLSARSSRVGKFVNYYPASRQPQSGSPSHKRHTSPYAFHVPPNRLRSPAARASSPNCPYGEPIQLFNAHGEPVQCLLDSDEYDLVPRVAGGHHHEDNQDADHVVAKAEIKQTRYGYVAPLARVESKRQPLALSKFNKSLKSQTIGHIPSMVQVSVDDNLLSAPHSAYLSKSRDLLAHSCNNRSEADLLKAHRVVWRNSNKFDAGLDNPFRPGTELSLEADLMVRLIKRGYPIDELPHLVQATKEVIAAKQRANSPATRSKSCDKLAESNPASRVPKSTGYLNSNLRQFNDQAYEVEEEDPDEGRGKGAYVHSVSHSYLLQGEKVGAQQFARTVDDLEPCKRIWANSLSRAKSMPRFSYTAKGEDGNTLKSTPFKAATMKDDVDSLDKLISDIEREISDLLKCEPYDQVVHGHCIKESHEINRGDEDFAGVGNVSIETVKTKQRSSPNRKMVTPNSSPKREAKTEKLVSSTSTPSFSEAKNRREKNDLTSSRSDELLLDSGGNSADVVKKKKKKKSRCCLIQ